jgi:hypothetical protein
LALKEHRLWLSLRSRTQPFWTSGDAKAGHSEVKSNDGHVGVLVSVNERVDGLVKDREEKSVAEKDAGDIEAERGFNLLLLFFFVFCFLFFVLLEERIRESFSLFLL